jgi:hypothetical protein
MKKVIFVLALSAVFNFGAASFADTPNLSDTEFPRVDLVSLSNQNIEVSKSASDLLITVTASDNLNNIELVYLGIYRDDKPSPSQVSLFPIITSNQPISTSVVNNRVVSVFKFKITIPKGLASGNYYIYTFARDAAGNYPTFSDKYTSPTEMPKHPESTFVVKNDSSGTVIDVTEFDLVSKMKDLQSKYDSLVSANKTLTNNYDSILSEKIKSETDLKSSIASVSALEAKYKAAEEARQNALKDADNLRVSSGTLKLEVSRLQSQLVSANKKLALICKAKPKPKGC